MKDARQASKLRYLTGLSTHFRFAFCLSRLWQALKWRVLENLTRQMADGQQLDAKSIQTAVEALLSETLSPTIKAEFLSALSQKGETPDEIAGFASALRARAILPQVNPALRLGHILDLVCTGGEQLGTFNISTTAALVCAAAGVTVAKHGNRAVTSKSGSADVLEALGIRIDLKPDQAMRSLEKHQFAFFFAPLFHPAFQHVGAARKLCAARGQRTIFNLLGPLLNPALPSAMVLGVPRPQWCEPLAKVLQTLEVRRAMVVCGRINPSRLPSGTTLPLCLDELSSLGDNTIAEFYQCHGLNVSTSAPEWPADPQITLQDLLGGDKNENAEIIRRLLNGQEKGARREAVLLNAAAGLWVAEKSRSLAEGRELANEVLNSGLAAKKLKDLTGDN